MNANLVKVRHETINILSKYRATENFLNKTVSSGIMDEITVQNIITSLQHTLPKEHVSDHVVDYCMQRINELIPNKHDEEYIYDADIIMFNNLSQVMGKFSINCSLEEKVLSQPWQIGPRFAHLMMDAGVISMHGYMTSYIISQDPEYFKEQLFEFLVIITHENKPNVLKDYLVFLLFSAHGECVTSKQKQLRKFSLAMLEEYIYACHNQLLDVYDFVMSCSNDLSESILSKFSSRQISVLLSSETAEVNFQKLIENQHQWNYHKIKKKRMRSFQKLLLMITNKDLKLVLDDLTHLFRVNWPKYFSLLSIMLYHYPNAKEYIEGLSQQMIMLGLSDCQRDAVILGLLIARHAAAEGLHVFKSYRQWLEGILFEIPELQGKRGRMTFFQTLTILVPFEKVYHLKDHVVMFPKLKSRPDQVIMDYIALVKTRLIDLKENVEDEITYESRNPSIDSSKDDALNDVENAIKMFSLSKKIPMHIAEASIFRQSYFTGRFLKHLLKPRILPEEKDARMEFIEELHRRNKIATKTYTRYVEACRAEASGAHTSLSERNPIDELQKELTVWATAVCHDADLAHEHAGRVRGFISELFHGDAGRNMDTPIQIVEEMLNAICQVAAFLDTKGSVSCLWITPLLRILAEWDVFVAILPERLAQLFKLQVEVSEHHLLGLALILRAWGVLSEFYGPVRKLFPVPESMDALCCRLNLRFGCYHLLTQDGVVVKSIINRLLLIFFRLRHLAISDNPSSYPSTSSNLLLSLSDHMLLQKAISENELVVPIPFGNWFELEQSFQQGAGSLDMHTSLQMAMFSLELVEPLGELSSCRIEHYAPKLFQKLVTLPLGEERHCSKAEKVHHNPMMLLLLQRLCSNYTCRQSGSHMPWVMQCLVDCYRAATPSEARLVSCNYVAMLYSLPPASLLSCSVSRSCCNVQFALVVLLRVFEHLSMSVFYLDFHLMCLVLRALETVTAAFPKALEDFPVLAASIVVHWHRLPNCLTDSNLQLLATQICNVGKKFDAIERFDFALVEPWIFSFYFFVRDLWPQEMEVPEILTSCLLKLYMCEGVVSLRENFVENSKAISLIKRCPSALLSFKRKDSITDSFLEKYAELIPVVIASVLLSMYTEITFDKEMLKFAVINYSDCLKLLTNSKAKKFINLKRIEELEKMLRCKIKYLNNHTLMEFLRDEEVGVFHELIKKLQNGN